MIEPARQMQPAALAGTEIPSPLAEASHGLNRRFAFAGSLRRRAGHGVLINAAFTVGAGLLALLKGFILAGFLSRGDYGLWGIIAVSLSTLVWFKQAGIGDKFVQQDEPDQELAFQQAFTLELIATAVCAAMIVLATPVLVLIYGLPRLAAPCLVIAAALLVTVLQSPLWIYYRRMEFARQRLLAAIDPVVSFVVSVALAAAGAGYWAFVGGFAAGACASALAAALASPFKLRLRFERRAARGYWSFSAPLLLSGGVTFVMAWAAVIAARFELGLAAVGVIALAESIAGFTEQVDELVTSALYPAICAVREKLDLLYESLVKSNRLVLMWAAPLGFGLTLFCGDLVRFGIGERWRSAVFVIQVFGAAAAVNQVGFNWTAYLRALNRTRPIAIAAVAATIVFLITGLPLLFVLGLRGFAIGIALQGMAALILRAYYLQQIFPGFDFLRHATRSFLPTAVAAAAILVLRAVEPSGRTAAVAAGELALYVALAGGVTWQLESKLVREAVGILLGRPAAAVTS